MTFKQLTDAIWPEIKVGQFYYYIHPNGAETYYEITANNMAIVEVSDYPGTTYITPLILNDFEQHVEKGLIRRLG